MVSLTPEIEASASYASYFADAASYATEAAADASAYSAEAAVYSVVRAIETAAYAAESAGYAAEAAAEVAESAEEARAIVWRSIRMDCAALEKGEDIFTFPLWSGKVPFERFWLDIEQALTHSKNAPETWRFWLDWYAAMLDPIKNPPDWGLYAQVALIEDEAWDYGPEAIAERIEKIEGARQSKQDTRSVAREEAQLLLKQVERLERVVPALSNEIAALREHFEQVKDQAKSIDQNHSKASKTAETILAHTANAIAQSEATVEQRFEELQAEYEAKFQASLDTFNAANRIKAPVELWSEKEREHEEQRDNAFGGFVLGLFVIAIAVGWVGYTLLNPSENLILALSPVGCDLIKHPELCKGFSFRGMILSGSVLTLLTLALWFTRIQMKQYLSERHLVLDARERRAFAQTYIGLIEEGDTSKEAQEQRALVYAALFRPSSDGIIKDEGGIDPSLTAALSKLLAGK